MPRNRKKAHPPPTPVPLTRRERRLTHLIASPLYLMSVGLAFAAAWSIRTGVATGRGGDMTRAGDPFGFYFSVAVLIALALFTGYLGVKLGRSE
jgi:hypothetical protein